MIYIKNQMVSFMKHTVEVMIPETEIKARIAELGRQINEHYKDSGSEMVLVGLLRGSFMFMADLCREVQVPHEVDFMTASSYGSGMSTTRDVKILKDLDEDIRGKDVLIVLEDDDLREHSAHWEAGAKQNFDTGLYTAHTILYIRVEDYGPKPKIGKQLVLDKGTKSQRTFTINLCQEESGVYRMTMERTRQ